MSEDQLKYLSKNVISKTFQDNDLICDGCRLKVHNKIRSSERRPLKDVSNIPVSSPAPSCSSSNPVPMAIVGSSLESFISTRPIENESFLDVLRPVPTCVMPMAIDESSLGQESSVSTHPFGDYNSSFFTKTLELLNSLMTHLNEPQVTRKDMKTKSKSSKVCNRVCAIIETKVFGLKEDEAFNLNKCLVAKNIKEGMNNASFSEKSRLLSLIPMSVKEYPIRTFFNVSQRVAEKGRQIAINGIFSNIVKNSVSKHQITQETIKSAIEFYYDDSISRVLPGASDAVSVAENGVRVLKQKRLLLDPISEIYNSFKEVHNDCKISLSKFFELRPKECVNANGKGLHNVCVCKAHENFKLMFRCVFQRETLSWKNHIALGSCNPPNITCLINECDQCPKYSAIYAQLSPLHNSSLIVKFQQWESVDRSALEPKSMPYEEFLNIYIERLINLKRHDFLTKVQCDHFSYLKQALDANKVLVSMDFSENLRLEQQNSIQNAYYSTPQISLFPVIVYFKSQNETKHHSLVYVSDDNTHDTTFVHVVQQHLTTFIKTEIPTCKHIDYFTDGAGGQFKNRKNFYNLLLHKKEFGLTADWHFFTTSHGKGAVDGIGGSLKRNARANMLRTTGISPRNAKEFCETAYRTIIKLVYLDKLKMEDTRKKMEETRYKKTKTVPGTHNLHYFKPSSSDADTIIARTFSTCEMEKQYKLLVKRRAISNKK